MSTKEAIQWQSPTDIAPIKRHIALCAWLDYAESMTAKLNALSQKQIQLHLHKDGWGTALPDEIDYLEVSSEQQFWIRHTVWTTNGHDWLIARAVIPYQTLAQDDHVLQQIGNTPIGDLIFQDPNASRQHIEVSPFADSDYVALMQSFYPNITNHSHLWLKRSQLYFQDQPILIVELFLDDFYRDNAFGDMQNAERR